MAVSDNLGLYLPTREDYISVTRDITNNFTNVDGAIGGVMGGALIVCDGDTHIAITDKQYIHVRNNAHGLTEGWYTANGNIAANAQIDSSNTNAVSSAGAINELNSNIAQLPICRLLKRSNITQSPGYDNWTISGFTQLSGYTRRVIAINPSVQYITFIRTDDSSGDQITVYLYNSNNSSVTFNLEVIGIYIPNNLVAS